MLHWKTRTCAVVMIAIALNLASVRASPAFAQQPPIVGGYADTSNTDPEAVAAARFAIRKEKQKLHTSISLLAIKHAEVQVVAGLNYRLCMRVKIKGKTRNVTVVVYKNLKQKYSLTSWVADGCKKQ